MTRSPTAVRAGASRYVVHTSASLCSRSSSGSSAAGVSQYRIRWGLRSASFEQPPGMAWRDPLDDASTHDFVRQLAVAPLADGSVGIGWPLTGQGDDLAHLLRCEARRSTTPRGIGQPLGDADCLQRYVPKREPAPPPMARCLVIQVEPTRDLGVVQPVPGGQHNARSHGELLTRGIPAHQALQLRPFLLTQHNLRRSWRHASLFTRLLGCCILSSLAPSPVVFRPTCTSLSRQRLGQTAKAELGRTIGSGICPAALARNGRNIDDRAASCAHHVRQDGPRQYEWGAQVHRQYVIPCFGGQVDYPGGHVRRRGVHENVDTSPLANNTVDGRENLVLAG